MLSYLFSGHDTFQCRQLWLKKGYDYIASGKSFADNDAGLVLGVGRNMVGAIRHWMKAFGLLNKDNKLTEFANRLLAPDGWDPYLEDEASLWLLHYQLVKRRYASTFSIVFTELRREKIEFTKKQFVDFVKRKADGLDTLQIGANTLTDDFTVMTKTYVQSAGGAKDREDSYAGILSELDLIKTIHRNKEEIFFIDNTEKPQIPAEVILYTILDYNLFDSSISFSTLEQEIGNVVSIFALNRNGLLEKIEQICDNSNGTIVFNDQAGIKELQFKGNKPNAFTVLEHYYEN